MRNLMRSDDWIENSIFGKLWAPGFDLEYFEIWKPKVWHTVCIQLKDEHIVLNIDGNRILKRHTYMQVLYI